MIERIKAVMAHYQLRAAQFSDAIGMQRSAVSHVLSGRNKPSLDFVLRIKRHFPEISLDWLTLGEGNMLVNAASQPDFSSSHLFSGPSASGKASDVAHLSEDQASFSEKVTPASRKAEVRDEDPAPYGPEQLPERIEKVIFVYGDGTFRELISRK